MPNGRFMASTVPLIIPVFLYCFNFLIKPRKYHLTTSVAYFSVLAVVILIYPALNVYASLRTESMYLSKFQKDFQNQSGVFGVVNYLNENFVSGDSVACPDVGIIGYYYLGKVIDYWGLANKEIAISGQGGGKIMAPTVLRMRPKYIVLYSNSPYLTEKSCSYGLASVSERFLVDNDFQNQYRQVFSTPTDFTKLYYTLWKMN